MSPKATALALTITLIVLFILCAIAQALFPSIQASHMWISLFTAAPIGTAAAWIEGLIANIAVGLVAGHCFAFAYNRFAK